MILLLYEGDLSRIAFDTNRGDSVDIYVMKAKQTRLTGAPASDMQPAWSPDNSKIAFVSNRDGNCEIYVMNADGSKQTRLTTNPANDLAPKWR